MESANSFNYLFQPIMLGGLEIKNRIVMSAMAVGDAYQLTGPGIRLPSGRFWQPHLYSYILEKKVFF